MTERRGFVLRVKPDRIDAYVEAHRHVWPELLEALRAAGIRNYTIFRAGNEVFGYFESDDLARAEDYLAAQDVSTLMEFYLAGRNDGNFDSGIERALRRLLADPEFVYRREAEPVNVAAGKPYRISDLALASRLSFFLWSSIPDDELMSVASQGHLHEPAVLEQQVKRMLVDPKSGSLIT